MKKKILIFGVIIILVFLIIIVVFNIIKNKNKFDYQLEIVKEINYMMYSENNKFGVINKTGEVVVQAQYDEVQIPNPSKPLFICKYNYNWEKDQYNIKVLNDKSEQILYEYVYVEAIKINPTNDNIPYEKSVLKYMKNGKYGLINFQGKQITKPEFEEIKGLDCKEGLLVVKKNGKYGVININGVNVIKEKYDSIECDGYYEEGTNYKKAGFIVGKNNKYGYINYEGKQILKDKYDQIDRIVNNNKDNISYLIAFENNKAGFYKDSKNILKHEYEDIYYDNNNNCLVVQKKDKQGILDINGNTVIDINYNNIFISGKYINAQNDEKVDIYNYETKDKVNIDNIIGLNQIQNDNYSIAVTKDDRYKILDIKENKLLDIEYDYLEYLYDNFYIACNNQKYGIIDITGKNVINFKYDFIQKIGNSRVIQAIYTQKNITDFIADGKQIFSLNDCDIYINDNYILLQSNADLKYIDYNGNQIKNVQILSGELFAYNLGKKWGFVNKDEQVKINPEYDLVTEFNEYGFAGIKIDNKWGVINIEGNVVVEPTYVINFNNPYFIGKFYKCDLGYGEPFFVCNNIE